MNVLDSRCSVLTSLVYDSILQPRARMIRETISIFDFEFVSDCFPDDPGNYILYPGVPNLSIRYSHLESNTFIFIPRVLVLISISCSLRHDKLLYLGIDTNVWYYIIPKDRDKR